MLYSFRYIYRYAHMYTYADSSCHSHPGIQVVHRCLRLVPKIRGPVGCSQARGPLPWIGSHLVTGTFFRRMTTAEDMDLFSGVVWLWSSERGAFGTRGTFFFGKVLTVKLLRFRIQNCMEVILQGKNQWKNQLFCVWFILIPQEKQGKLPDFPLVRMWERKGLGVLTN